MERSCVIFTVLVGLFPNRISSGEGVFGRVPVSPPPFSLTALVLLKKYTTYLPLLLLLRFSFPYILWVIRLFLLRIYLLFFFLLRFSSPVF